MLIRLTQNGQKIDKPRNQSASLGATIKISQSSYKNSQCQVYINNIVPFHQSLLTSKRLAYLPNQVIKDYEQGGSLTRPNAQSIKENNQRIFNSVGKSKVKTQYPRARKEAQSQYQLSQLIDIDVGSSLYVITKCIGVYLSKKEKNYRSFDLSNFGIDHSGHIILIKPITTNIITVSIKQVVIVRQIALAVKQISNASYVDFVKYYQRSNNRRQVNFRYMLSLIKSYMSCSKIKPVSRIETNIENIRQQLNSPIQEYKNCSQAKHRSKEVFSAKQSLTHKKIKQQNLPNLFSLDEYQTQGQKKSGQKKLGQKKPRFLMKSLNKQKRKQMSIMRAKSQNQQPSKNKWLKIIKNRINLQYCLSFFPECTINKKLVTKISSTTAFTKEDSEQPSYNQNSKVSHSSQGTYSECQPYDSDHNGNGHSRLKKFDSIKNVVKGTNFNNILKKQSDFQFNYTSCPQQLSSLSQIKVKTFNNRFPQHLNEVQSEGSLSDIQRDQHYNQHTVQTEHDLADMLQQKQKMRINQNRIFDENSWVKKIDKLFNQSSSQLTRSIIDYSPVIGKQAQYSSGTSKIEAKFIQVTDVDHNKQCQLMQGYSWSVCDQSGYMEHLKHMQRIEHMYSMQMSEDANKYS